MNCQINLLPLELQENPPKFKKISQKIIFMALSIFIMTVFIYLNFLIEQKKIQYDKELSFYQGDTVVRSQENKEYLLIKQEIEQTDKKTQSLQKVLISHDSWANLILAIQACVPANVRFETVELGGERFLPNGVAGEPKEAVGDLIEKYKGPQNQKVKATNWQQVVFIQGKSSSVEEIGKFLTKLNQLTELNNVQLNNVQQAEGRKGYNFTIFAVTKGLGESDE